ncbi:DotU family type IV/VI secretion system protein [Vibrio sp. S9_S30]|uniref:type IVB secretion system protein IcmH/DotU n=1 Tax=Vibrio sp. S9_S30 TaxID=2720226 RepID=UPI001680ADE8|nr:type IVB secretion system protein IcmH/DotU [Vibrio sp. S9_S30]MBD1557013.1 DotU family type IV/VI secretion system protein [Vibrio sp. S9_S30]
MIVTEEFNKDRYDELLFDEVKSIDADQDYWFKLRGDNQNKMIDAATPLLGLSLRIRSLAQCENIETIYKQAQEEIKAIEMELVQADIEHAMIMAYRYVLCAVLDEAVMSTPWGADSSWAEHSLLTRFHNETWGGEKVFTILNRLLGDPPRYRVLLEFIYLCLMLGFEGKYKVVEGGKEERERVAIKLYETLSRLDDKEPEELTSATDHVVATKYRLSRQMPIWLIFAGFAGLWAVVFFVYRYLLNSKSLDVLNQLNQIL